MNTSIEKACNVLVPQPGHFVFGECKGPAIYRVAGTLTVVCRACVDKYMGHIPPAVLRPIRGAA